MSHRVSIVALVASLALPACVLDEMETEPDLESDYEAADILKNTSVKIGDATDLLSLEKNRNALNLSKDVLRILKHSAGKVPEPLDEQDTMDRWYRRVDEDVHLRNLADAQVFYEHPDNAWIRISLGLNEELFENLTSDQQSTVLRHYRNTADFWRVNDPMLKELDQKLDEIKDCDACPLPVNAPQLFYYTQYFAFRVFRSGVTSQTAINACMYLESLQNSLEKKLRLINLSRTGISTPRRPPVETPFDAMVWK